jgi:hypothetical protein
LAASLLAGCTPTYLWDINTTSTPGSLSFDVVELAREPVAVLGPLTPAGLQRFGPPLSHALATVLSQESPSVRGIFPPATVNLLNDRGLAAEYADLISGFVRSGILERERLQRIGSGLGSRYILLAGLAELSQVLVDKFELAGIKVVRNRVVTMRLWLQLWDTQQGHLLWESAGESVVASQLLSPQQTVPLEQIAQQLWRRMLRDNLLRERTRWGSLPAVDASPS